MGLRRNPADMSNETLRYLGYNWDHENGYNISWIIDENLDEIVEKYSTKLDEQLQEAGDDKVKASEIAGANILQPGHLPDFPGPRLRHLSPYSVHPVKHQRVDQRRWGL